MIRRRPHVAGAVLAVGHFAACLVIVPLTLRIGGAMPEGPADSFLYGLMAVVTKILYFPILTLALYPRYWFPGQMITIPIAVNSLLWGLALTVLLMLGRRFQAPRRR